MDCESDGDSNEDFEDALEDFLMLSTNKNPVNDIDDDDTTEDEDSSGDKYLLVSSSGPAAEHNGLNMGLFRKSEDTREGRSVYIQENNTHYGRSPAELFSDQGVWSIKWFDSVFLRAATPSVSPKSVTWQYVEDCMKTWREDPALTVTGLSEKPSECEITISLPDITEPGVAGLYTADGSYYQGRPVLRHSGGRFTLFVGSGCWIVSPGVGGAWYLMSGSALSQCPKAARNKLLGMTHCWMYRNKQRKWTVSRGIIVKCNKHTH